MTYQNKQISNGAKSFTPHHFSGKDFDKMKITKSGAGFTLIEIIIVIGIMLILIAIAFSTFRFFRAESDLNNSTEEIINTLRLAQSKTLASEGAAQWGVYFLISTLPHQYILFQGENYASRNASFDETFNLSQSVEIYDINLAGEPEAIFDRLIGSTGQSGSISLRLIEDPAKTQIIYIENSGQVGLAIPPVASDEDRIKDSRHVHFDLGWSIQNATTVKFYFPDVLQTEEIDIRGYFNVDKTEFDWEGKFVIGGVDQVFRLHTHSLDAFDAVLCVHRDRNEEKNDQEVIIYIKDGGIDKDIVRYLADSNDTVEKGFYVNTMERQ